MNTFPHQPAPSADDMGCEPCGQPIHRGAVGRWRHDEKGAATLPWHYDRASGNYLTPLPAPLTDSWEQVATHICRWFNRTTGDWVVSMSDAQGGQVGPSTYVATRQEAEAEALYLSHLDAVPRVY